MGGMQPLTMKGSIIIDDHTCIGMRSIILSGTHIGEHALVVVSSVMSCRVPARTIAAGDTARMARMCEDSESAPLKVANST